GLPETSAAHSRLSTSGACPSGFGRAARFLYRTRAAGRKRTLIATAPKTVPNTAPKTAMVLAAGLGKRMRPITDTMPKPLVKVAGKTLLDWALDELAAAGVGKAVVNVHYFPEQIVAHTVRRGAPKIVISDESGGLLDSAGGIVKALPELGEKPFYVLNADTFWIDSGAPNLARLALAWDDATMDILLMLADIASA